MAVAGTLARVGTLTRNLRLLYAYWFLRDFQLWIPVWIVFLTLDQGFTLTQVFAAEGLYLVGVIILEVPTGAVADRWGRARSLAMGATCLGVAILLFGFTSSFAVLLASFMLWSVASTLMSGADNALLFDILKAAARDYDYERHAGRGAALAWVGAGLATGAGGPVAAWLGVQATIFIGAATCLATALMALLVREPPRVRTQDREVSYLRSIRLALSDAWQAVDVRVVILLSAFSIAALSAADYLVQPYLLDREVEVGVGFSLLQLPLYIAAAGGGLAAGMAARRWSPRRLLLAIPVAGVLAYASLLAAPGLLAYPAFVALAVLVATTEPIAGGYINRRIESDRRATVLSLQGLVSSGAMAAIVPGLGVASDELGLAWAFGAAGLIAVATVVVFAPAIGAVSAYRVEPAPVPAVD